MTYLRRNGAFIGVILILVSLFVLLLSTSIRGWVNRPLEQDELVSMKLYGPIGYTETWLTAPVKSLNAARTVRGVGKCFVNYWTPNNHIVHSIACSLSTFLFGYHEWAFRIPALLSWLATVVLIFSLCYRLSQSLLLSFLLGAGLLFHPYLIYYGQTARGYTVCLLLISIQLAWLDRSAGRPLNTAAALGLAALGIASILNLLSMLLMWMAPLLCVLLLAAYRKPKGDVSRAQQLRGWLLCAVVIGVSAAAFVVAKMQLIQASQAKYGIKFSSLDEAIALTGHVVQIIAPGWWGLVGVIGCVGWFLMFVRGKWLGMAIVLSLLLTAAYAVKTNTYPYERVFGFYIPLMIIGVAFLWSWLSARRLRLLCGFVLIAVALVDATAAHRLLRVSRPFSHSDLALAVNTDIDNRALERSGTLILLPWMWGEEMRYYLPADTSFFDPAAPHGSEITTYLPLDRCDSGFGFRVQVRNRLKEEYKYWNIPNGWAGHLAKIHANAAFLRLRMERRKLTGLPAPDGEPHLISWTPKDSRFDLGGFATERLLSNEIRWALPTITLQQACPASIVLFCSDDKDIELAGEILAELNAATPGDAWVLSAVSQPVQ